MAKKDLLESNDNDLLDVWCSSKPMINLNVIEVSLSVGNHGTGEGACV